MYFVPEAQHDRSQARSAWDSATPKEPYEIGRCEGRSIDKGRIIGLDSVKDFQTSETSPGHGRRRIQRPYLAGSAHYFEQQFEHHGRQTFQEE